MYILCFSALMVIWLFHVVIYIEDHVFWVHDNLHVALDFGGMGFYLNQCIGVAYMFWSSLINRELIVVICHSEFCVCMRMYILFIVNHFYMHKSICPLPYVSFLAFKSDWSCFHLMIWSFYLEDFFHLFLFLAFNDEGSGL